MPGPAPSPPTTRILGNRRIDGDPLAEAAVLQRTLNRLRKADGLGLVPRGVYRFTSHEDADRWMTTQIATSPARRKSKIK